MKFKLDEYASAGDDGIYEINLIPLIDIMLVLMIIFMVTATVVTASVPLTLPGTAAHPLQSPPAAVTLSIDAQGQMYWDQQGVSLNTLTQRLQLAAAQSPQPTLLLRTDREARYDVLAQVMGLASAAGIRDLAFVSVGETAANKP